MGSVAPAMAMSPQVSAPLAGTSARPSEHLSAVAAIVQGLGSASSFSEGFERVMALLQEELGLRCGALFTLEQTTGAALQAKASYGAALGDFRPCMGRGVAGRVAESARPIVVPLVRREPMALSELTNPETWIDDGLSLVSLPLLVRGQAAGAFSAYLLFDRSEGFAGRLGLLQVVASLLAQELRGEATHIPKAAAAEVRPRSGVAFDYSNMIGTSTCMRRIYEEVAQVAGTRATVLVLGESGTGKELVASAIHANSTRARGPFVKINTAAVPESLFESELFGHERGAFTGALQRKKGRLDLAQGGTLFLDEIGDLPPAAQVKLLRVLQNREFERVGGTETIKADVRIIAATNKHIERAVQEGQFREDLYYRLNVFTITLPSLRERCGDLPGLIQFFTERYGRQHQRMGLRVSPAAGQLLAQHTWPGNVRELENAIERAVIACDAGVIEERHLPQHLRRSVSEPNTPRGGLAQAVEELERRMISEALQRSEGNMAKAARELGTTERVVRYKVGKYGISAEVRVRSRT
ncbi:MAG: sigma 54-interacting transcriptional regulator [Myxococcales bacterium]